VRLSLNDVHVQQQPVLTSSSPPKIFPPQSAVDQSLVYKVWDEVEVGFDFESATRVANREEDKMFQKFLWLCTALGSLLGGVVLLISIASAKGAPQEAAGAAIALCLAVIPYCFARSNQLWDYQRIDDAARLANIERALNHIATNTPPLSSHPGPMDGIKISE
jgi:hypothetical protein